jgi:hypothetical protein
MKTLVASLVLLTCLLGSRSQSQTWKFFGPDSASWRSVIQMDVSIRKGMPARVGVGTTKGIALHLRDQWKYPLRNYTATSPSTETEYYFRTLYFSPWDDSVAFVGSDELGFEGGSTGYRAQSLYGDLELQPIPIECWIGFSRPLSFVFPPHDAGMVYAWVCDLLWSPDGGASWWPRSFYGVGSSLYPLGFFLAINHWRDSVLYIGGRARSEDYTIGVYTTSDTGMSWNCINTFLASYTKADFLAQGDTLVLATSKSPASGDSSCGVFRSSDHGNSWSHVLSSVNVAALARDDGDPSIMFAASERGVYRSVDAGATWQMYNNTLPSLHFVGIKKDPYSDTLYVATQDSGICKVFGLAVNAEEEPQLPKQCKLEQNFPNPFNPTTEIQFEIPVSRFVSLEVYDVLGREVAVLVSEWKSPGRYSLAWDARGLASGVYFYRIKAGNFVETKKLLLLR